MGFQSRDFENDKPAEAPKFELLPLSRLTLDRSCDYLIKGLMPATGLQVLYGPPGVGKSFLALDAALHVAAGRTWAGRKVRQGGVIYVASEGARSFRKRVIASVQRKGFDHTIPFALIETAPDLGRAGDLPDLLLAIETQCRTLGFMPRLIVLDTLSRSIAQMNESDARDMNVFITNAAILSKEFGALVMPVHHTGKDMDRGMRGSSSLNGAADAVWCLKRDDDGILSFGLEKMKDGEGGSQIGFSLIAHPLGVDEERDAIETLIAEVSEQPPRQVCTPAKPETSMTRTMAKIQAAFDSQSRSQDTPSEASGMLYSQLRRIVMDEMIQLNPLQNKRTPAVNFDRDFKGLLAAGKIVRSGHRVRLNGPGNGDNKAVPTAIARRPVEGLVFGQLKVSCNE